MRLPLRQSPYRARPRDAPGTGAEREPPVEPAVLGVLVAVLGCSLMRLALFFWRDERHGPDGALALAASAVTAYYLSRRLRG